MAEFSVPICLHLFNEPTKERGHFFKVKKSHYIYTHTQVFVCFSLYFNNNNKKTHLKEITI